MLYANTTEVLPFVNSSDMFVQIRRLLTMNPDAPTCIWAYWGALDTIQHDYGTWGEAPTAEVRNLAYSLRTELLEPMRRSKDCRATLMMTADHGHIQVAERDILPVKKFPKLKDALAVPPTGTTRSACLHLRNGATDAFKVYLKKALNGRATVLSSGDALEAGLWGPGKARAEMAGRVGDLLLLMQGSHALFYPYRKRARPSALAGGMHGGLSEEEMLIPFFCAKL